MQRSGYKLHIVLLVSAVAMVSTACVTDDEHACRHYREKEMGQLATFVRVAMDIVNSEYMGAVTPALLPEEKIKALIAQRGAPFKELELLNRHELVMVSRNGQWATVAWDPENDQKLLQDLRCTTVLDEPSWKTCSRGHEFTLDWRTCH